MRTVELEGLAVVRRGLLGTTQSFSQSLPSWTYTSILSSSRDATLSMRASIGRRCPTGRADGTGGHLAHRLVVRGSSCRIAGSRGWRSPGARGSGRTLGAAQADRDARGLRDLLSEGFVGRGEDLVPALHHLREVLELIGRGALGDPGPATPTRRRTPAGVRPAWSRRPGHLHQQLDRIGTVLEASTRAR